jgi:hypothetical protein
MTQKQIQKLERFTVEKTDLRTITVNVGIVYRGNFNDQRQLESRTFSVAELADHPLLWFDPYLGKNPKRTLEIAFVYLKGRTLYFLEKDGDNVVLRKREGYTYYYTDEYDEGHFLSCEIF